MRQRIGDGLGDDHAGDGTENEQILPPDQLARVDGQTDCLTATRHSRRRVIGMCTMERESRSPSRLTSSTRSGRIEANARLSADGVKGTTTWVQSRHLCNPSKAPRAVQRLEDPAPAGAFDGCEPPNNRRRGRPVPRQLRPPLVVTGAICVGIV